MNPLIFTYALNSLLMIAMPIGLAIVLLRRWKLAGRIWWLGAFTFVLSQVGHLPFNSLVMPVFNRFGFIALHPTAQMLIKAIFLGLSAGLFEEGARYLVLRFWLKEARSWRTGILFGAGHGGVEAIILGALALYGYIQLLVLRTATPDQLAQLVGQANVELAQAQLTAAWSAPWYGTLLGAVERLFTIPTQIAMAVMVMQVFTRKNIGWLFAAIGYHTLLDALAVFGQSIMSMYALEAIIGGFAVLSLVIIFLLRQPEPVPPDGPALAPVQAPAVRPVAETEENLDNTKYN